MASVITGIVILSVGGFIIYKIIKGIAAFVDALQDVPEAPNEDAGKEEGQ